ncbi:MAG: adenylosuccinate synthase [Planctomycetota bacterium]
MNSNNVTVIGLQWGDEGKGKIVDALAQGSRYVVRFCGGANAGHTVRVGEQEYALHLIPSGILHANVCNVLGNGVAFDPAVALEEIRALDQRGIEIPPEHLLISDGAHVVMPWHKLQDRLSEEALDSGRKIGTTARGIGPCYSDRANRSTAIRVIDLLSDDGLSRRIRQIGQEKNRIFAALYDAEPMNLDAIVEEFLGYARALRPRISNAGAILRRACRERQRILFEGGQGSMLDVDHGTYPFVTSSNVTACGIPAGAGISPKDVGQVIGLIKSYTSRVGAGPFPTEQDNEIGQRLRDGGNEYGTTTGRPRRCGWFDAFAVRYACDLSGVDSLALSLLDVLTGFDEVRICTGYRVDGEAMTDFHPMRMDGVEPVYETLPGWSENITGCRSYGDLPTAAQAYVQRVEQLLDRPVAFISVGPDREATIEHNTQIAGL